MFHRPQRGRPKGHFLVLMSHILLTIGCYFYNLIAGGSLSGVSTETKAEENNIMLLC